MKWKVTNAKDRSFLVNPRSKFVVQYIKGEYVRAPIGGCLVFDCPELAGEFARAFGKTGGYRIWKVRVKHRIKILPSVYSNDARRFRHVRAGKSYLTASRCDALGAMPRGTEAWREVKLIELVSENMGISGGI